MSPRYRQHVNPLKQSSLVPRQPLVIPEGPEVECELGCGDGLFLVQRARRFPQRLLIGLDIRPEFLDPGLKAIRDEDLANVRLEVCNLSVDAGHLFPAARVRRFWINFPDPWFKRRQRNRRWLDSASLAALVRALEPGGSIVYQSDVWDSAIEALGLMELREELDNRAGAFTFSRERLCEERTSRELACEREGRRIWRMHFSRK